MIDLGDVQPLTINIRDSNGNLANAGAVTLTIGLPDGTSVSPTPSNPSVGVYQYDYAVTQPGRYSVRWVATGQNACAFVDGFDVRPADPGYIISLADAKAQLNIPATNTADDEELRSYLEAVTVVVENYRNEAVVRRTVVEEIDTVRGARFITQLAPASAGDLPYGAGGTSRRITLGTSPIQSVTSVARVDGTFTWDLSLLDVDTAKNAITVLFGPLFYGFIRVIYQVGYTTVPPNFTLAARIILGHLWDLQRQPSIGSGSGGLFARGELDTGVGGWGAGFAIPNRAAELLGGRPPVIA